MSTKNFFICATACITGVVVGVALIKNIMSRKDASGKLSAKEIQELYSMIKL